MSEDIVEALVTLLKADAVVSAAVGARVFGVELPPSEAANQPRKAVVITPSGGVSFAEGSFVEHDTQRLDAFCYGETVFEAAIVRRAVSDAFRAQRRGKIGTTLIHWVQPAGGQTSQRESDVSWPVAFQSFQAFYALQAA